MNNKEIPDSLGITLWLWKMIALEVRKTKQNKKWSDSFRWGFMTSNKCGEVHLWEYYKKAMSLPQK